MSKFWDIRLSKDNPRVGELILYGPIISNSWWFEEDVITPKRVMKELDDLGSLDELHVYINSLGGDVFAGQALYSILKRNKTPKKIAHIDGVAASAATLPALACELHMGINSMLMIHKAWTCTCGNAIELRKAADDLDKINESIIAVYVDKTGLSKEKVIEYMDNETWFTADEAFKNGFADKIDEDNEDNEDLIESSFDLYGSMSMMAKYKNIPERVKNMADNAKNKTDEMSLKFETISKELATSNDENKKLVETIEATNRELDNLKAEILTLKPEPKNDPDPIATLPEEIKAMVKGFEAEAKSAKDEIKKIRDEQVLNTFIAKAKSYEGLGLKAEEFGPVMKALSEIDSKYLNTLDAVLKASSATVEQSQLFDEFGSSRKKVSTGEAWSSIVANSKAMMVADPSLKTVEQAQAKYLETVEGQELYSKYINEVRGE